MSRLTAGQRHALPADAFALPGGRFPIENASHARAALSDAHNVGPAAQATIKAKVHARYPQIGQHPGSGPIGEDPRGKHRHMIAQALMGL